MLPDWPVPKSELQRAFMRALAHELRHCAYNAIYTSTKE